LFLILIGLIVRGIAFEFRSKDDNPTWRKTWDTALFVGSFINALLWGVAIANIVRGVPIDASMTFTGNLLTLLNPYALLGGVVTTLLFALHGGLFLSLKTDGPVRQRAESMVKKLWVPVVVVTVAFVGFSFIATDMFASVNPVQLVGLGVAVVALLSASFFITKRHFGRGFIGTGLTVLGVVAWLFGGLFPRVMPSSLGAEFDLTIYNAASSPYTLQVMTVVALIFVPLVLLYQGWTYYVFRERVTSESHLEY
jgi:cytochrome d ubiquinol oxidase subunit II